MSLTDPIGDLLTSIRNASQAGKKQVDVRASNLGKAVVECLKQEGFVDNWRFMEETSVQGTLRVYLKYTKKREPILRHVKRISKPVLRVYVPKTKMPKVLSGIGIAIVSSPEGVMTDAQARAAGVGGEVICHVW
jgi:small subunit ribosomal protein S8